ncbi:uncharacterized protein LOC126836740 [Adelges cooleyi]|uniref:uncharacterized protein LOC126836740 n=1 Tax=Adelges cooleyi TaxID=133065 RepID=UPI0021804056|nr:uncharacterized protein LOC126836740 [Adelges cooleyi]
MSAAAVGFALVITSVFSFAFFYLMKYAFHTTSSSRRLSTKSSKSAKQSSATAVASKRVSRTGNRLTSTTVKKSATLVPESKRGIVQKTDRKLKPKINNEKSKISKPTVEPIQEKLPEEVDERPVAKPSKPLKPVKETLVVEEPPKVLAKPVNTIPNNSVVSNSTNNSNIATPAEVVVPKQNHAMKTSPNAAEKKIKPSEINAKKNKNNDIRPQTKQNNKPSSKLRDFDFDNFDVDDGSRMITKLIEKCDLSRDQTQYILDTLLNKQQSLNNNSNGTTTEWVKPSDSAEKKLKKRLQETEIQLKHLEEQLAGAHGKARDHRTELNTQITRAKHFENKLAEMQALRNQEVRERSAAVAELSKYKNNTASLESQLEALRTTLAQQQQQNLDQMAEKESTIVQLRSEIKELQEQLAAKIESNKVIPNTASTLENENTADAVIERPAVEGREYVPGEPDVVDASSGAVIVDSAESEAIKKDNAELKRRCDDLQGEVDDKEKQLKELTNKLHELTTNAANTEQKYRTEIESIKSEKRTHEEKNKELRTKNFKVLEALKQTERALEARIKSEQDEKRRDNSKANVKRARQLLRRQLLPQESDSDESSDKEHLADDDVSDEKWSRTLANKVRRHYEKQLQRSQKNSSPVTNQQHALDQQNRQEIVLSLERQNDKLHRMVTHYKSIISDTETMLSQLHKHVENEESRWCDQILELQQQLDRANSELQQRRKDEESSPNTTMNSSSSSS